MIKTKLIYNKTVTNSVMNVLFNCYQLLWTLFIVQTTVYLYAINRDLLKNMFKFIKLCLIIVLKVVIVCNFKLHTIY